MSAACAQGSPTLNAPGSGNKGSDSTDNSSEPSSQSGGDGTSSHTGSAHGPNGDYDPSSGPHGGPTANTGGDGDAPAGDADAGTPGEQADPSAFPVVVDDFFAASGYAGDGATPGLVNDQPSCPTRGGEGRGTCHTFSWTPGNVGWASVFWQYPANNWGPQTGRVIPDGATEVSFYAWSDKGGESIQFGAGLNNSDAFSIVNDAVTLGTSPKQYTISLANTDYGPDVISAFMWTAAGQGAVSFHVDDIVWLSDGNTGGGGNGGDGDGDSTPPGPAPDWPAGPGANGVSLRVRNLCNFPLFINGGGKEAALAPDKLQLNKGEIHNYDVPKIWTSARVNAFANANDAEPRDKAELTFYHSGDGKDHVSYNVTYVDWLGLPIEITSPQGSCQDNLNTTACYVPQSEVLSGCPQGFLRSNDRCLSPRTYCLTGHQNEAYCHLLDNAIANCPNCPKGSTTDVYACAGVYGNEPRMCAALNRGMVSAPDDPDESKYYQTNPYNDYSKWVHEVCPGIYAFPYDDWLSHGGYRDCSGSTEVRITFCPGG